MFLWIVPQIPQITSGSSPLPVRTCMWHSLEKQNSFELWNQPQRYNGIRFPLVLGYQSTHPFNQGLVLLWLTEVSADILCRDCTLLALVHPALVLLLLRDSIPEDLESLPYGLLAHWSDQRHHKFHKVNQQSLVILILFFRKQINVIKSSMCTPAKYQSFRRVVGMGLCQTSFSNVG